MEWQPIHTAPHSGVVLLAVQSDAGECRTFAAEASHSERGHEWQVTVGWMGWQRLHSGWLPMYWMPLPSPPGPVSA